MKTATKTITNGKIPVQTKHLDNNKGAVDVTNSKIVANASHQDLNVTPNQANEKTTGENPQINTTANVNVNVDKSVSNDIPNGNDSHESQIINTEISFNGLQLAENNTPAFNDFNFKLAENTTSTLSDVSFTLGENTISSYGTLDGIFLTYNTSAFNDTSSLLSFNVPISTETIASINNYDVGIANNNEFLASNNYQLLTAGGQINILHHPFISSLINSTATEISGIGTTSSSNLLVKAATALTQIFNPGESSTVATLAPATFSKVADTSGFFTTTIVPTIAHTMATSNPITEVGNSVAVQAPSNHIFFITPQALSPINSSSSIHTINLASSSTIGDDPFMVRKANATSTSLTASNNSPGSLIIHPTSTQLTNASSLSTTLTFSENNTFGVTDQRHGVMFADETVPASISSLVRGPANATNIYDLTAAFIPLATNPVSWVFPISDYSPSSTISSMTLGHGIGMVAPDLIIDATNNITLILYNQNVSGSNPDLFWVDSSFGVHGQGLFSSVPNPGAVIDKGSYNYVNVADMNHDGSSDLLFGSNTTDNAILLYGSFTSPTLLHLDQLPNTVQATKFIMPTPDLVGVALPANATPLDGGAALNALSTPSTGVNFVGDINGDGIPDIVVEKHSSNYSSYSDIAYVIYGQQNNFPNTVQLASYGDSHINNGIVGTGLDANGNFVQNVSGFTVTGPVANTNGTVAPDNFSIKYVGDLNSDGYGDLIAFANNNAAYVIFGHPDNPTSASNLNLGVITSYELPLFFLPHVANSTTVPTINDISGGSVNGDGLGDLVFSPSISVSDLQHQTIPFSQYLTAINNSTGTISLGSILSGAVFTDSYFNTANNVSQAQGIPVDSAYSFKDPVTGNLDTSHIILGLNNQSTLAGFTGIDNLIGGTGNQLLIEHGFGTTNPNLPGVVGSTLIGGNGNNTFEVADAVFHEIQGGSGLNTLRLDSGSLDLTQTPNPNSPSLADQASHIIHGIEDIQLGNNANLSLNLNNLLNINNNVSNGIQESFLGTNDSGGRVTGTILISATNGTGQDPNHAPTLNIFNDPQHQWTQTSANESFNGVPATLYTFQSTNFLETIHVFVTQNVHTTVHG